MPRNAVRVVAVLAVRVGDRITKIGSTDVLTVDQVDWVLEHESGPIARFVGVPEGAVQRTLTFPLAGVVGCLTASEDDSASDPEPSLRTVDLVGGDAARGVVAQYSIAAREVTGDHLGLLVGTHSDDGNFNVLAQILRIKQIPHHPTRPGTLVEVRQGAAPSQPARVESCYVPPEQVFELIELYEEGDPNYRHPRCYANTRGGCSATISGEHYISHALIKLYTFDDPDVTIMHNHGAGVIRPVRPKKFVANVLCTSHNHALHVADDAAIAFARFLRNIAIAWGNGAGDWGDETEVHISGDDMQAWVLKLLLNHAAASAFTSDGNRISTPIPNEAVDLLLGHAQWPQTWGLCVASDVTSALAYDPFSDIASVTTDWWSAQPLLGRSNSEIGGGTVRLAGIDFGITLFDQGRDSGQFDVPQNPIRGSIQRPSFMRWEHQGVAKTIHFSWNDNWEHQSITYSMYR